jgi:DNA repair protein RecO (recombination protein O)
MRIIETEAIVLHATDTGESDRVVTFYTEQAGMVSGMAKGARRSRKRFVNAFEPFSLVRLTLRERRRLAWIEACKLVEAHLVLRNSMDRWAAAALAGEVLRSMVPAGEAHPELFGLFKETLSRLCTERDPLNAVILFLLRFMDLAGYLPDFERCGLCGRAANEDRSWWWLPGVGALICSQHPEGERLGLALDLGTVKLIGQVKRLDLLRLWRLRVREDKKRALLSALTRWVESQTHRPLKSVRVLEQVGTGVAFGLGGGSASGGAEDAPLSG